MAADTVAAVNVRAMQVDVSAPTALIALDMNGRIKVENRDMGHTPAATENGILS